VKVDKAASLHQAVRALRRRDPVLRRIMKQIGPCPLTLLRNYFWALAEAIVSQQLSVAAAATIFRRLRRLYPHHRVPRPVDLLATPGRRLRSAGLSRQKVVYLKALATAFLDGRLPVRRFHRMSDEEVVEALTRVKGVGRWTAEMFLIFVLARADVFPVGDLGLQKAIQQAYRLRRPPAASTMQRMAARWRPYRTVATWYLWASRDGKPVVYGEG
jgi:3-methyladenine DNA glycosylase/8-oxoguanine DNA glycosylase